MPSPATDDHAPPPLIGAQVAALTDVHRGAIAGYRMKRATQGHAAASLIRHRRDSRSPAAIFMTGSEDFYPEERPVHWVAVNGFWTGEHQVTATAFRHLPAIRAFDRGRTAARSSCLPKRPGRTSRAVVPMPDRATATP